MTRAPDRGDAAPATGVADRLLRTLLDFEHRPEQALRDAASERWAPEPQRPAALRRVRRLGYDCTTSQPTPGVSAPAVPILDAKGGILAGSSLGGPAERFVAARARDLLPTLLRTARQIAEPIDRPIVPARLPPPTT